MVDVDIVADKSMYGKYWKKAKSPREIRRQPWTFIYYKKHRWHHKLINWWEYFLAVCCKRHIWWFWIHLNSSSWLKYIGKQLYLQTVSLVLRMLHQKKVCICNIEEVNKTKQIKANNPEFKLMYKVKHKPHSIEVIFTCFSVDDKWIMQDISERSSWSGYKQTEQMVKIKCDLLFLFFSITTNITQCITLEL